MRIKMKFYFYLLLCFLQLIISCSSPIYDNPFDTGNSLPSPSNLSISQISLTSCQLTWNDNLEGEEGFRIDRKKDDETWQVGYTETEANIEEFLDTNIVINSSYSYRLYAFADKNITDITEVTIDMIFPAPTNLQITQNNVHTFTLNWDDNSYGEDGFKIDKKVGTNAWQEEYASLPENTVTWTDVNCEINEEIQYRIYAFSGNNQSDYLETSVIDNSLAAPANLTYNIENLSSSVADIHLNWDYYMSGIDGFKILKNGTLISEIIPVGTTEWIDQAVSMLSANSYQVMAFYQIYNSAYSNLIEIEIIGCVDFDGNIYDIVTIGDQIWMAENLKVTHYRNGDQIQNVTNSNQWTNLSTGAFCFYDNDANNGDTFGVLYNWYAIGDNRKLAPEGWHVPSDEEIMDLEMYLGMSQNQANSTGWRGSNEGSKLAGNSALWVDGDLENDPEFGISSFDLFPGGYRNYNDGFYDSLGDYGYFWSSSDPASGYAWYRRLYFNSTEVHRYCSSKNHGFSVRCIRD